MARHPAASEGEDLDPVEAARREVEWWRAHRELQYDHGEADERSLVDALTQLYTCVGEERLALVRSYESLLAAVRTDEAISRE